MHGTIPPVPAHPRGHRTPPPEGLDVDRLDVDADYLAAMAKRPEVLAWMVGELSADDRATIVAKLVRLVVER